MKTVIKTSERIDLEQVRRAVGAIELVLTTTDLSAIRVDGCVIASDRDQLPLALAARATAVVVTGADGPALYRVVRLPVPQTTTTVIADIRMGANHTGFRLVAQPGVTVVGKHLLVGVQLDRDGRTYIARPGGAWDVFVEETNGRVEALNEQARVLDRDTDGTGAGWALLAAQPGGVVLFGAYKNRRAPEVGRYLGPGAGGPAFEWVTGVSAARAAGWLPTTEPPEHVL